MTRALRTTLTLAALGALAVAAYLSVTRSGDDEPATEPPVAPPPDAGAALREITVKDSLRLRWSRETDRGAQPDLVLVMAEGLEIRTEGPQVRYRVGAVNLFCFDTGGDALTCEPDSNPSELVPEAGTTRFAALIADPRVVAGRNASCWSFTAETTTTETCVDDETEVLVYTETADTATGARFLQTLVEWEPATESDLALPPEVDSLVG